ncbi:MAG: sulfotransferase domain-containing protein [Vicinamibacterales bacterium]
MTRLPDFLIIGAAKAGTTTLYEILRQHPQVFLPAAKEPAFFSDDSCFEKGVAWYRETYYRNAGEARRIGDATSMYLAWGTKVVPRLAGAYGGSLPRIIAIFRDPVALTHSYYWHSVREGRETLPFRDALDAEATRSAQHQAYLERSGRLFYCYRQVASYATHLEPYLAHVPASRRLFLLTDDLKDFPALVRRLEAFLELDHAPDLQPAVSNAAAMPRSHALQRWLRKRSVLKEIVKPIVPERIRQQWKMRAIAANLTPFTIPALDPDLARDIRRHYAPEMRRLEAIVGRDLSAWYGES